MVFDTAPSGGNVGGEWAYASGLSGAPGGAKHGITAAGFGLFGNANFGGPNLDGPDAVNGMGYGLLSSGDHLTTGNNPVTGNNPFIQHAVVFKINISGGARADSSFSNVWFQYGTSLTEPNFPGQRVPEPGTLGLLLAAGIPALLAGILRRRR